MGKEATVKLVGAIVITLVLGVIFIACVDNDKKRRPIWITLSIVSGVLAGIALLVWRYYMMYKTTAIEPGMDDTRVTPVGVACCFGLVLLFGYGLAVGIGRSWSYFQLLRFPNKKRRNRHLKWIIMQWVGIPVLTIYMLFLIWMAVL